MFASKSSIIALLVASALVAASCFGGDDADSERDGAAGPIEIGVRSVPLSAYDEARDANDGRIEMVIGDLAAVADLNRLAAPERGRDLERDVASWFFEVGYGVDTDDSEITLPLPQQFQDPRFFVAAETELGIDVGAAEQFVAMTALPFELLVITGDLELSSQLDEVSPDVFTSHDGDDYAVDVARRGVDLLGRPTRVAASDRSVAMSLSTPAIEAWLDGGDSLADEEDYLAAARAVDSAGAVGALFFEGRFDDFPFASEDFLDNIQERALITESFEIVALAMTANDGDPGNAIAYVFSNEREAEDALDGIEEAWSDAELLSDPGTFISDLVEFQAITRDGTVVTVEVTPAADQDTALLSGLIFRQDLQFLHS